jgi:hypothetical protein
MEVTMGRTRIWGGDDNAPIPKDNEDGPLAKEYGPLAKDTLTRDPSSSFLRMGTSSSLPQLHVLSIVSFIAASDYRLIDVSDFPMQF